MNVWISKTLVALLLIIHGVPLAMAQRALIPDLVVSQYAGNIGMVSAGVGWQYGQDDRWETHLLLGYLPHTVFTHASTTTTLRQTFRPWELPVGNRLCFSPLVTSLSANTINSGEFWWAESSNNAYYRISTKLRFHLGIGNRLDLRLGNIDRLIDNRHLRTKEERRHEPRISVYYELSTYDLAVLSYVRSSHLPLSELLSLGFGIIYRFD